MKKIVIALLVLVIGVGCLIGFNVKEKSYIRIHIRANSNSEYDQSVKYMVKDTVVEAITPLAKDIKNLNQMYELLENNLDAIKGIVDVKLGKLGVNYLSNIRLNKEQFPTRTYEDLTLQSGIYDALIIELGSGVGDNWWCVAYPPLCFVGAKDVGDGVHYKSRIKEFFDKLAKNN